MATPERRPALAVVRAGNPGHESTDRTEAKRGLQLPSAAPAEPRWEEWFPAPRAKAGEDAGERRRRAAALARCRAVARGEWRRVVPLLDQTGMLSSVDRQVLVELCVVVARVDECERQLSVEGMTWRGERGMQRHGATIVVRQYRDQLKWLVGELGLSPAARQRLSGTPAGAAGAGAEEGDSPYDV